MTAAEILRNAQPPADDALIEKAIADLDNKIWEWTESLKSAHAQLRSAFAVRPVQRPSTVLFEGAAPSPLQAAAAAAHIPAPPPMPAEWTAPPPLPAVAPTPAAVEPRWNATHGGHGASGGAGAPQEPATVWAQPSGPGSQSFQSTEGASSANAGVMQWPSTPAANTWPESNASASSAGAQSWPTWTPTDIASGVSTPSVEKRAASMPPSRPAKIKTPRPVVMDGPTPEERAQKAAAEEALLAGLEEAIARRVRLLRRLDPDTAIEKLIEKAQQGHAEALAAGPAKEDKSSSWWRRK